MRKFIVSLAGVLALGSAGQALAGPVIFDIDSVDVKLGTFSGHGAKPVLTPFDFNEGNDSKVLSAGEAWDITLFSIQLPVIGIGSGTVSASLYFDLPTDAVAVHGSAKGSYWSFFIGDGSLEWISQPDIFSLDGGGSYSVEFKNLSGLTLGRSADVHAILTLLAEPGELGSPEPGTLALLGLGMLGVALASRRRNAAARAS